MDEKPYKLEAPWRGYTDILGGVEFKDSVSEPVDERTANRLEAAVGCKILLIADEAKPAKKSKKQLAAEAEAARLAEEEAERQRLEAAGAERKSAIAAAQAELQAAFEKLTDEERQAAHDVISRAGMQAGAEAMEAAKAANPEATPAELEAARVKAGDEAALLQSVSTLGEYVVTAEVAAKLAALLTEG
jgi:hypothetical protein